jgi:hypothetical protein
MSDRWWAPRKSAFAHLDLARRANQLSRENLVYPPRKKYFAFAVGQISATSSRHPTPTQGAFRDRHERGEGSGGRGSVGRVSVAGRADEACERSTGVPTNDVAAYGKAVWSWHPLLVSSWRRFSWSNRVLMNC